MKHYRIITENVVGLPLTDIITTGSQELEGWGNHYLILGKDSKIEILVHKGSVEIGALPGSGSSIKDDKNERE